MQMHDEENDLRTSIITACRRLNDDGLNHGTAGNISLRVGDRMLITPSGVPYEDLRPEMIASTSLGEGAGRWSGPLRPSTEWRFHRDILLQRPDVAAIVHAHSPFATTLSLVRRPIPACHYMIAAFGGMDVRVADYATFGTEALSNAAVRALDERQACLLANHGMITVGNTLSKAMWLAAELEAIAQQYYLSLGIGGPVFLTEEEVEDARRGFANYGLQPRPE